MPEMTTDPTAPRIETLEQSDTYGKLWSSLWSAVMA